MKKLMIAAAIVCAAAMSQATTYKWSVGSSNPVYDGYNASSVGTKSENAVGKDLKMYLVYYTDSTGVSQADLLKAIRSAGNASAMTSDSVKDWVLATSKTDVNGKIIAEDFTTTPGTKGKPLGEGEDHFYLNDDGKMGAYAVIFNADESMVAIGSVSNKAGDESFGSTYSITTAFSKTLRDKDGTHEWGDTGWYSTVPEPTSGLLLLLGVAGLALRRRRA